MKMRGRNMNSVITKMKEKLDEAERKAKEREISAAVNLGLVAKEEEKANELGFGLYKLKTKNKTPFVQHIHENINVLLTSEYITINELGFLTALQYYLAMGSNAIKNPETEEFMTISDIARKFGMNRSVVSRTVSKLIDKGLILEIVNGKELRKYHRNISTRPLFLNPEIIYMGDKNQIDPMLCDMVMEFDCIEKNKIHLPYKVWHSTDEKYGKIITRKTYLKYKKQKSKK